MSWKNEAKVEEYVGRVGRLEARQAGEVELTDALPATVERVLDIGCGDGRLTALVLDQVDCNWRWRGFALLVGQAPR